MQDTKPSEMNDSDTAIGFGNKVILFNDEIHTFEQVTNQVMKAVGCSERDAFRIAYMVDRYGSAVVFVGEIDDCFRVSSVLEEIGLITSITV